MILERQTIHNLGQESFSSWTVKRRICQVKFSLSRETQLDAFSIFWQCERQWRRTGWKKIKEPNISLKISRFIFLDFIFVKQTKKLNKFFVSLTGRRDLHGGQIKKFKIAFVRASKSSIFHDYQLMEISLMFMSFSRHFPWQKVYFKDATLMHCNTWKIYDNFSLLETLLKMCIK